MEISKSSNEIDTSFKTCENNQNDTVNEHIKRECSPNLTTDNKLKADEVVDVDFNSLDAEDISNRCSPSPYLDSGDIIRDPCNISHCNTYSDSIVTSTSLNNIASKSLLKRNLPRGSTTPSLKGTRGFKCPYRVTFLESVVSDYLEPSNPWEKDHTSIVPTTQGHYANTPITNISIGILIITIEHTTEDLVLAYLSCCESYHLKIIPLLFQQLKAINDFTKRNETFTLKGEKLHYRNIETLEEVFKRVQFRTIDVENTNLDAETAVILFEIVEFYQSCIRLNISHNKSLGIRGWQGLSRLIKKMSSLKQLDIRGCCISEQMMPIFCRSLRLSSYLTVLHLENSVYSGRHIMILVAALKMNTVLEELYLCDNKLMSSDGIHFGAMFKFNTSLRIFDLRNNHLQDVGVSHIFEGLSNQQKTGLRSLILSNNQLSHQSMHSLARLIVNTNTIETLNIANNNISNEGIYIIKDALLTNNTILHFDLQSTKISCQGAISLAEFIAEPSKLLRLDLRDNNILTGGLMALSLGFKVNLKLRRLDLDKRPKKEQGIKDYTEQQSRLLFEMSKYTKRNLELSWENDNIIGNTTKVCSSSQDKEAITSPEVTPISSPSSPNSVIPTKSDINMISDDNNELLKLININKQIDEDQNLNDESSDENDEFIASPIQAKALLSSVDRQVSNEQQCNQHQNSSVIESLSLSIDACKLKIETKVPSPQVSPNGRFHISKVKEDKKYVKSTSSSDLNSHSTIKQNTSEQIIEISLNQQINSDSQKNAINNDQSSDISNINDITIVIEDENC